MVKSIFSQARYAARQAAKAMQKREAVDVEPAEVVNVEQAQVEPAEVVNVEKAQVDDEDAHDPMLPYPEDDLKMAELMVEEGVGEMSLAHVAGLLLKTSESHLPSTASRYIGKFDWLDIVNPVE